MEGWKGGEDRLAGLIDLCEEFEAEESVVARVRKLAGEMERAGVPDRVFGMLGDVLRQGFEIRRRMTAEEGKRRAALHRLRDALEQHVDALEELKRRVAREEPELPRPFKRIDLPPPRN